MIAKPVSAALLILAITVTAAQAEQTGTAPATTVTVATANTVVPKTKFRLFAGRKAREETKQNAVQDNARAELKLAVAEAVAAPKKGRVWCVPFARNVSGIQIRGNAGTWWGKAANVYARGNEPKVGAVMNFSSSKSMPMGHVAVVSKVVSDREVLVDQANWERNRITQDTLVVDVSASNDWSQVKVANSGGTLGRTNPVHGFIYKPGA